MIKYIIIATVFFFQLGYIVCTENELTINHGEQITPRRFKFMCTIHRSNPGTNTSRFICNGVLVGSRYAITLASCVDGFNDRSEMFVYVNAATRDSGYAYRVIGITFNPRTRSADTNIAILKLASILEKNSGVGAINMPKRDDVVPYADITVVSYGPSTDENILTLQKIAIRISPVQNRPPNSFVAHNYVRDNVVVLSDADKGAPACLKSRVIGILSSTTGIPDPKATFVDLFVLKSFIQANTRRRRRQS